MAKKLAVVEIDDEGNVVILKDYGEVNPDIYEAFLAEGQEAVIDWSKTVTNIFSVMVANGLVNQNGFNFEGFTISSFVDFMMWAKNKLPLNVRNDFKYRLFDTIVLSSVSRFSSTFSEKGREIRIDFERMSTLLKPIGYILIKYALKNKEIELSVGKELRELVKDEH